MYCIHKEDSGAGFCLGKGAGGVVLSLWQSGVGVRWVLPKGWYEIGRVFAGGGGGLGYCAGRLCYGGRGGESYYMMEWD